MIFEVHYEVLRSVDCHPCGPRIRTFDASNHVAAADLARRAYGEDRVDAIRIDGVSTRDQAGQKLWHFLSPGFAWGGRRAGAASN
ncbi:hypothetical protein [Xanthobacter flavus]|uniref:hypothetical protein n=1 Tax=Xanthobacter flavus TaxID=281 RepID=UPI003727BC0D